MGKAGNLSGRRHGPFPSCFIPVHSFLAAFCVKSSLVSKYEVVTHVKSPVHMIVIWFVQKSSWTSVVGTNWEQVLLSWIEADKNWEWKRSALQGFFETFVLGTNWPLVRHFLVRSCIWWAWLCCTSVLDGNHYGVCVCVWTAVARRACGHRQPWDQGPVCRLTPGRGKTCCIKPGGRRGGG